MAKQHTKVINMLHGGVLVTVYPDKKAIKEGAWKNDNKNMV